ncbi:DMT family transporter [Oceanobacillus piezotolerans]|uniref:DMT family transporter n=1 Tax=Oceanobacillus piezotolerans TaxID=2448030 RepID=A0A498D341_9BACI|nr:DMT family transporter [Oceanobacillus piezotolerans]RLL42132.1 DMT family transporter [Oceanobacillus piezotolerans]
MRIPPFNPYIALIIGVISVSTSAVLVKLAAEAPTAIIGFYRLFLATLIMAPIILTNYRHEFRLIQKKNWIFIILAGVFLALHFILWFESLNYTSVTSSVLFISILPLFAFLGTYLFLGERFSPGVVISMIIIIFGSVIIGWGDLQISGLAFFGDTLAIFGAIAMTAYLLFGQQTRKHVSLITYTFIIYGISSLTLFLYNVILQNSFSGYSADYWAIFAALAIIPTFLGHSLFNWASRWLSNSTISMAIVLEPIGASILAYVILEETIASHQVLGGTIIIFGLLLFIISTSRKTKVTISRKK